MKRVLLTSILACCLVATSAFAADVKLGYIDMQRVLNASDKGIEAKEQLAARATKYREEINAKQENIKKLKDELEIQGMLISDSARTTKEKEYQQRLKEFERFTKDAQDELQGKDAELTRKIIVGIEKIIQEFGRKNDFTFIFTKNPSMVFTYDKADITEDILKIINSTQKNG